jgi:DnaK suppressor protein
MTRTQFLRQTEQRLISRRRALRAALAGDQRLLQALSDSAGVGDEVDAAVISEQAEIRSQLAQVESRELAQIDRAIEKIRAGRYGSCEICERPISPQRLKYLPYAAECIDCARREERRGTISARQPVNRIAAYADEESEPSLDKAELEVG